MKSLKTLKKGESAPYNGTFFSEEEMVMVNTAMKIAKELIKNQEHDEFKHEYRTFSKDGVRV